MRDLILSIAVMMVAATSSPHSQGVRRVQFADAPAVVPKTTTTTALAAAADYVDAYAKQLSGIVLQETYTQNVRYQLGMQPGLRRAVPPGPEHRELKSDLLLIRPENADNWRQFRDVFEVDGKPLRDRNDRLARLFLQPSASAEARAGQLAAESARYNIGDIIRDINLPLLTLLVLDRVNQPRFKFADNRPTDMQGMPRTPSFAAPPGTRVFQYEEVQRGTLIKTAGNRDLPIKGRLWIEPDTGRVLLTELLVVDRVVNARIQVAYQVDAALKLLVPVEMHEVYERLSDHMKIDGVATYSNFRRFQVQVDESIGPIK